MNIKRERERDAIQKQIYWLLENLIVKKEYWKLYIISTYIRILLLFIELKCEVLGKRKKKKLKQGENI